MKSSHLVMSVVAIGALGAVAIFAGGGALAAPRATLARPDPAGLPAPYAAGAGIPFTTAAPRAASVDPPGGIPVVDTPDPVAAAPRAPAQAEAPAIVVSPAPSPEAPLDIAPRASGPDRGPASLGSQSGLGAQSALGPEWGPRPAPDLDPRPFSEAHWQGLEAIPRTQVLVKALGLPPDIEGVILDDVSLPGDLHGFRAGDLVTAVGGVRTPNLMRFIQATDRVREDKQIAVDIIRGTEPQRIEMVALFERLGTANGETPTMIPPGARSPHPYQGACLECHRIGTTGTLATDQGDPSLNPPPPIRMTRAAPHRDRGRCISCHRILP